MKYLKRFWQISSAPLICAVLGFAGAVCIVPFSGVMTALPLLPVCALLAGFVDMHPAAKATIFAVCGGMLGAGYSGEAFDIIVFAAICGISALLGHVTVNIFRDETKRFWAVLPLAAVVAIQLVFGGNIVSYVKAMQVSENYVNQHYDGADENVGKLEYHYLSGSWRREITSLPRAEAIGGLVVCDKVVQDNYVNKVERLLMAKKRTEIANVLRDAFPNGSFTVESEKIYGYPDGDVKITDNTDYTDKMVFVVYLGALTDGDGFLASAEEYREALIAAEVDVARVVFRGGGLGLYPMEEVNTGLPFTENKVKYNCGVVFDRLQDGLDRHFIKNIFLYN